MRPVPARLRAAVFFRGLLLQASWSPAHKQALGVAWALWPALAHLYPAGEPRRDAVRRHLGTFDTHPVLAAALLGGALAAEERIAAGQVAPEQALRAQAELAPPFSAIGDAFFARALTPLAALLAVLLSPWLGPWAPVTFLILHGAPHLALRAVAFRKGRLLGDGVVGWVGSLGLPSWSHALGWGVSLLSGLALALAGGLVQSLPGGGVGAAVRSWVLVLVAFWMGRWAAPLGPSLVGLLTVFLAAAAGLLQAGW